MCVQPLLHMRRRKLTILCSNYEQIGLKFLLYSAEILFNKGLCLVYLTRTEEGLAVMEEARQEKATEEHNVIDDAIQDKGEGYTVFSIVRALPPCLRTLAHSSRYSPSASYIARVRIRSRTPKLRITWARLYVSIHSCHHSFIRATDHPSLQKLVAATDATEVFTTFSGATRLQQGITPSGGFAERPPELDSSPSPVVGLGRSMTLPSQPGQCSCTILLFPSTPPLNTACQVTMELAFLVLKLLAALLFAKAACLLLTARRISLGVTPP